MRRSVAATSPTVLAAFHPEIEWRQAEGNPYQPTGAAWVGPQAVLEKLFMRLGAEWEGFTVTVHALHDAVVHVPLGVVRGRLAERPARAAEQPAVPGKVTTAVVRAAEEVGLLRLRHSHLRVLTQVVVQRAGTALHRADRDERRQRSVDLVR